LSAVAPNYVFWAAPLPPRRWPWVFLLIILLLANLAAALWYFAMSPKLAFVSTTFWIGAFLPAFCLWLLMVGFRLGWYALWQVHAVVNNQRNEADRAYWELMRCEQANLLGSVLVGPACSDAIQRMELLDGLRNIPLADSNILRISGLVEKEVGNSRLTILARYLADQVVLLWHSEVGQPDWIVWDGPDEGWVYFCAHLRAHGIFCPDEPTRKGGIEQIDWLIDRLHDETYPASLVLCAGMVCPEVDPAAKLIYSEVVFALMLGRKDNGIAICRPQLVHAGSDLIRAQQNAGLDAPPENYLQLASSLLPVAGDAAWVKQDLVLTPYWACVGDIEPWVTLLTVCDLVGRLQQPTGWLSAKQGTPWCGVVLPGRNAPASADPAMPDIPVLTEVVI
jgi:hypothetical protein